MTRVLGAQEAIEEVQGDDDTMALMYLSAIAADPARYDRLLRARRCTVMQAEVLLDAYALEFASLARNLSLALQDIDATEDLLRFKLDKARNQLIKIDVLFGMASMFLTLLMAITGYWGMNLPYGGYADGAARPGDPFVPPTSGGGQGYDLMWEGGPSKAFFGVSVGSSVGIIALAVLVFFMLQRSGALRS